MISAKIRKNICVIMQSLIPFLEFLIPEPERSGYQALCQLLEKNRPGNNKSVLQVATENLEQIRSTLGALKQHSLSVPFSSPQDEILFFKITKPHFHSLLVEWSGIFDLELLRPLGGRRTEAKYLRRQLRSIENFFKGQEEFFSWFRSGMTSLDSLYFLRENAERVNRQDAQNLDLDLQYTTGKDRLVSRLLGYERLQRYIEKAIRQLKKIPEKEDATPAKSALQWTASKAGLVELIYALHSGGVCNNGNADIKFIAGQFEQLFQVELSNFYHVFNEIRLRKKSRTQLLDSLKESVVRKMDEMDER
jgi:hypothetical protein